MQHFNFYTMHFNSNHKTKVGMGNCNETTTNRNKEWKRLFNENQMENKTQFKMFYSLLSNKSFINSIN